MTGSTDTEAAVAEPAADHEDLIHAACCDADYFGFSGERIYALCGRDVTGEQMHLAMPPDARRCPDCDELVRIAVVDGEPDCQRVCPKLRFGG